MYRKRRGLGRMTKVVVLAVATAVVAGAGVALGAVEAARRMAFVRPPNELPVAITQGRSSAVADSTRVRRLLESARGVNPLLCDLAARTVDGRSGWWSGSESIAAISASTDSLSRDVVSWVQRHEVDASSVPMLRDALADADPCVRRFAAPLIGRVEDRSASQAMLAALAASDAVVREMGALALGFADDSSAVTPLERRVRTDESPRVRATAAWALGEIERPGSAQVLIDALRDTAPLVRRSAARALGEIENGIAVPALTDLLKSDRDAEVRRAAALALGEILS